jgi:hypothetical protein
LFEILEVHIAKVGTGAEPAAGAGEDDTDDPAVSTSPGDGVLQLPSHLQRVGVQAVRAVQGDDRDRVVDLVQDGLVALSHAAWFRSLDG